LRSLIARTFSTRSEDHSVLKKKLAGRADVV